MTISEVLKLYPKIESELLLSHILRKHKEFIFLHGDKKLTKVQQSKFGRLAKLRSQGHPVAYLLGYKDFYGLRFIVNQNVLIPRPETEWLVDRVFNQGRPCGRVLDAGTGSGAIAVALAHSLLSKGRPCSVVASDFSAKALVVAKRNAKIHKVKIKFYHSDLFKKVPGKFDLIIANLPYIPTKILRKYPQIMDGLKYEPLVALTDGTNSWQVYRRFFDQVRSHVYPNAKILLETDPASKKFLLLYQKKYLPKWKISFYKDFNNLWRYCELIAPASL